MIFLSIGFGLFFKNFRRREIHAQSIAQHNGNQRPQIGVDPQREQNPEAIDKSVRKTIQLNEEHGPMWFGH